MSNPSYRRRALTRNDVIVLIFLVIGVLVLAWVLLNPSFAGSGYAPRTACAAHMSGIGKGLFTYANANRDHFPYPAFAAPTHPGIGNVRYAPSIIGKYRLLHPPATAPTDNSSTEASATSGLWTLIREGGYTPGEFICPLSNDKKNKEANPQDFWDFAKYTEISYGYQVPFGLTGQPNAEGDQRIAIAADKGPYGAALEVSKKNPGVSNLTLSNSPDDWRSWNSPNHYGEGQNVLYADSHADWSNKPTAGVKNDNIYTRWADATGGTNANPLPRIRGTPPTGIETPFGDTDSLIYP